MEFVESIDTVWLVAGVCLCCIGGVVLLLIMNVLGGTLGAALGIFEVFFDFLSAGPIAWCGCLVLLFGCVVCGGGILVLINILSTCDTPDAVNFCRFF